MRELATPRPAPFELPAEVYTAFAAAGVVRAVEDIPGEFTTEQRRQRRMRRGVGPGEVETTYVQLVRDGDLLRWELDSDPIVPQVGRRVMRRAGGIDLARTVIEQFKLVPAQGSAVGKLLRDLDTHLNPDGVHPAGSLRRVQRGQLGAMGATPVPEGRVLLLVHGTFSKARAMVDHWYSTDEGKEFFARAESHYDQVLAFEHPTLSIGPLLNALDLRRAFAGSKAAIDIVCHSRGGLVVRWWLEALDAPRLDNTRVVFVGAPLQGSSLAAPDRLRNALDLVTNAAVALGRASTVAAIAIPWVGAIGGIMRVLAAAGGAVAKTPVLDAAVAMIPGLAAQSRTLNNFELESLGLGVQVVPLGYHFVVSNFEPVAEDANWKFLQYFRRPKESLADFAVDPVFAGNNDLVVDTQSMTEMRCDLRTLTAGDISRALAASDRARTLDFGTSTEVHHLNYFVQPGFDDFVRRVFGIPDGGAASGRRRGRAAKPAGRRKAQPARRRAPARARR